jgi:PAS domain-containing protein
MEKPLLKVVEGALDTAVEWSWFCGHCAAPSPHNAPPPPSARVCHSCGLGLFLETRADVVPSLRDAFLVVDSSLLVQAVSAGAERLLGVSEEMIVDQPIAEFVVPADAEARGPSAFAAAVADAMGDDEPGHAYVRPWNTFGVRMRARIAACGPPRAALVVLETATPGLRLVGS